MFKIYTNRIIDPHFIINVLRSSKTSKPYIKQYMKMLITNKMTQICIIFRPSFILVTGVNTQHWHWIIHLIWLFYTSILNLENCVRFECARNQSHCNLRNSNHQKLVIFAYTLEFHMIHIIRKNHIMHHEWKEVHQKNFIALPFNTNL